MCSDLCDKIDIKDIQHLIVMNCAPVLAGLKISNLLVTTIEGYRQICELLKDSNIKLYVLSGRNDKVTILLYNRDKLQEYISIDTNKAFLIQLGYNSFEIDRVFVELAERYKKYQAGKAGFPHELGIVLGYPLEDVYGFINNRGQNYICSGYWKVYSHAEKTTKLFKSYDDITENMMRQLLKSGNLREMLAKKVSIS
ncbi:MAG: DUF3793 family protein [Butyrivibrio sp.]|nr:DUF3793 family protein [Butyrivibrio sp.]